LLGHSLLTSDPFFWQQWEEEEEGRGSSTTMIVRIVGFHQLQLLVIIALYVPMISAQPISSSSSQLSNIPSSSSTLIEYVVSNDGVTPPCGLISRGDLPCHDVIDALLQIMNTTTTQQQPSIINNTTSVAYVVHIMAGHYYARNDPPPRLQGDHNISIIGHGNNTWSSPILDLMQRNDPYFFFGGQLKLLLSNLVFTNGHDVVMLAVLGDTLLSSSALDGLTLEIRSCRFMNGTSRNSYWSGVALQIEHVNRVIIIDTIFDNLLMVSTKGKNLLPAVLINDAPYVIITHSIWRNNTVIDAMGMLHIRQVAQLTLDGCQMYNNGMYHRDVDETSRRLPLITGAVLIESMSKTRTNHDNMMNDGRTTFLPTIITITNCSFINNLLINTRVLYETCGAAVTLLVDHIDTIIVRQSSFVNNTIHSVETQRPVYAAGLSIVTLLGRPQYMANAYFGYTARDIVISDNIFENNNVDADGQVWAAGLFIQSGSSLLIVNTSFVKNRITSTWQMLGGATAIVCLSNVTATAPLDDQCTITIDSASFIANSMIARKDAQAQMLDTGGSGLYMQANRRWKLVNMTRCNFINNTLIHTVPVAQSARLFGAGMAIITDVLAHLEPNLFDMPNVDDIYRVHDITTLMISATTFKDNQLIVSADKSIAYAAGLVAMSYTAVKPYVAGKRGVASSIILDACIIDHNVAIGGGKLSVLVFILFVSSNQRMNM
jgi:hypothetical protein